MEILAKAEGIVAWDGGRARCAFGPAGVRADKHEGDGATPAGIFPLRRVLYRPDRLARPVTGLPVAALTRHDGWCDDPVNPLYNRQVTLPHPGHCEALWRADHVYDVIVILGHNDDPPVPGRGSAVFLHVARPAYAATEGCIALALADLLDLLRLCDAGSRLHIDVGRGG